MPCDEIQTTSVKLEAADPVILRAALDKLGNARGFYNGRVSADGKTFRSYFTGGLDVRVDLTTGKLDLEGTAWALRSAAEVRNVIQKAYTHSVIEAACNEFGIALEATGNADEYLTVGL